MTHSEQFLTDERDHWWSASQIRAIAARLGDVRSAVDVGCGQGHWTRVVASVFPEIVGIDREPSWIEIARARGLRCEVGRAEELPFPDASLDLVTAQTLLIHVGDPRAVLREFARVLKPGGALWLVEPNNLAGVVSSFASPEADVDELTAAFRLEATCERGKHALGLGYNSLGESLIHLLDGWRDVHVELCERVVISNDPWPPDVVTWPREETLRYWRAGGGDDRFDDVWTKARALVQRQRGAGGVLLYSYTARKP